LLATSEAAAVAAIASADWVAFAAAVPDGVACAVAVVVTRAATSTPVAPKTTARLSFIDGTSGKTNTTRLSTGRERGTGRGAAVIRNQDPVPAVGEQPTNVANSSTSSYTF
jgi:hypothetical protein